MSAPDPGPDCAALVASPPHQWSDAMPPVLAHGPRVAEPLVRSLQADPDGPGVQAGLAALGAIADPSVVPDLVDWLQRDLPHADEAALSLGRLGDPRAIEPLRACAHDHDRDVTTRTAAAAALLALGPNAADIEFLTAVLLAGTPTGSELAERHGLPTRTRWALERNVVIDAICRWTGGETFGLDADASWPRLERGTDAFARHAEQRLAR